MVVPGNRRVFLRNPLLELQKLDSSIHFIVHAITVKYDGFSRTPEPPEFRRSEPPRRSNKKLLLVGGALTSDWLPPANEVWGKVMFLHLCIILFTGGGGFCIQGVCIWAVCLWGCLHRGGPYPGDL